MTVAKTAVLGCGLMGSAVARTLLEGGGEVAVWNRTEAAAWALESNGATPFARAGDAVAIAPVVILLMAGYPAAAEALRAVPDELWRGRIIVNLMSGTADEAEMFARWAAERGADVLEGSIWTFPSAIGASTTTITYSGPESIWTKLESLLRTLGGNSRYVGAHYQAANVLEASFPGSFYMSAQMAFLESVSLAQASGIDATTIKNSLAPALDLLRASLIESLEHIDDSRFETDEATIDVFLNAAQSYRNTASKAGQRSEMLDALLSVLKRSVAQGHGSLGPAALVRSMTI